MNLLYQAIALMLWIIFISWITQDADAKRYRYHRKHYKTIEKITTAAVVTKIASKAIKQPHEKTND